MGIDEHSQPLSVLEKTSRQKAILNGSLLTSAALIGITTDVVGFMSFNISNQ